MTVSAVAVDDDGVVTLTPSSVTAGEMVTASLSDPDGGVDRRDVAVVHVAERGVGVGGDSG